MCFKYTDSWHTYNTSKYFIILLPNSTSRSMHVSITWQIRIDTQQFAHIAKSKSHLTNTHQEFWVEQHKSTLERKVILYREKHCDKQKQISRNHPNVRIHVCNECHPLYRNTTPNNAISLRIQDSEYLRGNLKQFMILMPNLQTYLTSATCIIITNFLVQKQQRAVAMDEHMQLLDIKNLL